MSTVIINPYIFATETPPPSPQSPQGVSPEVGASPFNWSPSSEKFDYDAVVLHLHGDGAGGESSPPGIIDNGIGAVTPESLTNVDIAVTPGAYGLQGTALNFGISPEAELRYTDVSVSPALFEFGTGDFTFEARLRLDAGLVSPADFDIITKWQDSTTRSYRWYVEDGNMYFRWSTTGSNQNTLGPFDIGDRLLDAKFLTLMCHRDGGTWRGFVNGQLVGEGAIFSDLQDVAADLMIGNSEATANYPLIGQMEEVRLIRGRALWSEQAASPFPNYPFPTDEYYFHKCGLIAGFEGTAGSPEYYDESRHVHGPLSLVNGATIDTADGRIGGQSLQLESLSLHYATLPNNSAFYLTDQEFTIEGMMKFESINTTESGNCLMALYTNTGSQRGWGWYYDTSISPQGMTFIWSTNGTNSFTASFEWEPTLETWYHLVVERDNSQSPQRLRMFLDGEEQTVVNATDISGDSIHSSTDALNFGRLNTSGGFRRQHDGEIDECRVIVGKCLYKQNFDPPLRQFTRDYGRNDFGLWTPDKIQGDIIAWYDPSDESTVNLVGSPTSHSPGRIGTLMDKGPNGLDISAAGAANAPEYVTEPRSGRKAAYYWSTANILDRAFSPVVSSTQVASVFCVATWSSLGSKSTFAVLFQYGASSSSWSSTSINLLMKNTSDDIYMTQLNATVGGTILSESPLSHDTPELYYASMDDPNNRFVGRVSGGAEKGGAEGVPSAWGDGYISLGNGRGSSIGTGIYANVGDYICETIVLDYVPDESERLTIEGYLAHRWGFKNSLPQGHPFRDFAP